MSEAAPVPGKYFALERDGQHVVCYADASLPDWFRIIARFANKDRAEDYAEIENMLERDWSDEPDGGKRYEVNGQAAPERALPPSAISLITDVVRREVTARAQHIHRTMTAPAPKPPRVKRRFTTMPELHPETVNGLPGDHDAVVEGRTLFPTTVKNPAEVDRVLVSGENNRKLGDRIIKGPWKGMPLYHLTLEERKTCPSDCYLYRKCYGNGMQMARRHDTDGLLPVLDRELQELNRKHRGGFVVRLHTLGDFYSVEYVRYWARAIKEFPNLRAFGYTARPKDTEIGGALWQLTLEKWDRFAIRWSSEDSLPQGSTTIFRIPEGPTVEEGIVCPQETGKTEACGTCGLCWHPAARDKTIVFIAHGPAFKHGGVHKSAPDSAKPESRTRESSRQAVLAAIETLHARGQRAVVASIAAVSGLHANTTNKALDELVQEGAIERTGWARAADWKIVAPTHGQPAAIPEKEPHPYTWVPTPAPAPRQRSGARNLGPDGLTDNQRAVWHTVAQEISEGGLSPSLKTIEARAGVLYVQTQIDRLIVLGYLEKSGARDSMMLHVLKWPHGIEPRETIGRADGHFAPVVDDTAVEVPQDASSLVTQEEIAEILRPEDDDPEQDADGELEPEGDDKLDEDLEAYLKRSPAPPRPLRVPTVDDFANVDAGDGWEDRPPREQAGPLAFVIDFLREIQIEIEPSGHSGSYIVDGTEMTPQQLIRYANNHRARRRMSLFVFDEGAAGTFGSSLSGAM